ncbi:hypothetical protein GCM10010413_30530 [Promicromonospora sukumoe]|uniref:Putative glyoxalase superfamily protein PhnB n=1 Tax=Promicromonospora sukumoe TaxID=88382 RepID=A0A7W3J7P1_9MICO|nr:VOC family protein [Promicromonospora sukumoe]MBA8807805.1 putative glyoxalase superfamily protein PhnB [Promicromonospora sukumoe]
MSAPAPRTVPAAPAGSATVDPFIWSDDAAGLIRFVLDVFDATEVPEARTADTDGLVLHSEVRIGDSTITIADRKPQWPYTPAFVRVYVEDPAATLGRAAGAGARIVTEPTEFWGDVLARFADPFGHLWWVYQHNPSDDADWTEPVGDEDWESFATPELTYVHSTLMEAMAALRDPRER